MKTQAQAVRRILMKILVLETKKIQKKSLAQIVRRVNLMRRAWRILMRTQIKSLEAMRIMTRGLFTQTQMLFTAMVSSSN